MDLKEIGSGGVGWIYLAQDREPVVRSYKYGKEPLGSIKCRISAELLASQE
jgi:hypothetical protein